MSETGMLYRIALSNLPGIGDITARKLLEHLGSAEAIFNEPYRDLLRISGIGSTLAGSIKKSETIEKAKREIEFIQRHNINTAFFTDPEYPQRLNECPDSPIIIYYKGDLHHKSQKIISIIGTRNATTRGKDICSSLITALALKYPDLVVISGLAYGIDITAHKASLKSGIPTIGVLAHGFNTLYPSVHTRVAKDMIKDGGLITDFLSDVPPERNNFLKRNRIIAGMSDATIVIESGITGGAMVTADIASSYSRELFAVPGFPGEKYSAGCNLLIKSNRASLVDKPEDIEYYMGWQCRDPKEIQPRLFNDCTPLELEILNALASNEKMSADNISELVKIPLYRLSSALLSLEFSGHIRSIPGNYYQLRS